MGQLVLSFILSPVTWVGALVAGLGRVLRIRQERRLFGVGIDRHWTGLWAGLIGGVAVSLVLDGMLLAAGALLPKWVWLTVVGLNVVALLLSWFGFSPWFFAIAGLVTFIPSAHLALGPWVGAFAVLVAGIWAATALLLHLLNPPIDIPKVVAGKRGAKVAVYRHRQWYWLPLVVPVPGTWFAAPSWWPTLGIGTHQFALLFVPLVIGAALLTKRQLPQAATLQWRWQYLGASVLALIIAGLTYWRPAAAGSAVVMLAVLGVIVGIGNWRATKLGAAAISETSAGVRLVAVQPDTPASKMALQAGDIILTCNHLPVHNEAELYAALQTQPTYCRLKVMRLDGAIRLAETAIFKGAPHELGMITFAEEQA